MLSGTHFYYQTIRRSVVAFGNLFKDIVLVKYDPTTRAELERLTVPLVYSGKEDFWVRYETSPELPAPNQIILPRMGFELTGIQYDPSRKLQSQLQNFVRSSTNPQSGVSHQYQGVPYNLKFQLNIFARNIEDGNQIVEQILPWFIPDYTLTMNFVDQMNIERNIPITLESVSWANDYQGTTPEQIRRITWTLDFNMQTYFFGPVYSGGIIKEVNANIFSYVSASSSNPTTQIALANSGLGVYQAGEYVFQGDSLSLANAVGQVVNFTSNTLIITPVEGKFIVNANIKGAVSAASWNVANIETNKLLVNIKVDPVPANANIGDDFGYSTTITEYN